MVAHYELGVNPMIDSLGLVWSVHLQKLWGWVHSFVFLVEQWCCECAQHACLLFPVHSPLRHQPLHMLSVRSLLLSTPYFLEFFFYGTKRSHLPCISAFLDTSKRSLKEILPLYLYRWLEFLWLVGSWLMRQINLVWIIISTNDRGCIRNSVHWVVFREI